MNEHADDTLTAEGRAKKWLALAECFAVSGDAAWLHTEAVAVVEALVRENGDLRAGKDTVEEVLTKVGEGFQERAERAEAALLDAKADARSWYEQCEAARDLVLRLGREKDEAEAALARLREALKHQMYRNHPFNSRACSGCNDALRALAASEPKETP